MSDAAVFTCPRCGATVERDSSATQARCRYCGTVVELPRQASWPERVPRPREQPVRSPQRRTPVLAVLSVCLAFMAIAGAVRYFDSQRSVPSQKAAAVTSDMPQGDVVKLVAPNLKAVDPASLIQQAGAAVRRRATNCELKYAWIGALKGGVLDATGSAALLYWVCHNVDKTKPPGQDVSDDQWDVRVDRGYLTLAKSGQGTHNHPPWKEPTCPFSEAWAAAVTSGMPADAIVDVYYEQSAFSPPNLLNVWSLRVNGH